MLGLWLLAACAAEGPPPPPPDLGPPLLELVNQGTGDDRPLEQAMLHSAVDNYRGKDNLLDAALAVGQRVEVAGFSPGSYHLTVVRKQRSLRDSDRVALTTARPIELRSGRYEVWVFDESFRIHGPTLNRDGGVVPEDGGVPDAPSWPDLFVDGPDRLDAPATDAPASDAPSVDGPAADGGADGDALTDAGN